MRFFFFAIVSGPLEKFYSVPRNIMVEMFYNLDAGFATEGAVYYYSYICLIYDTRLVSSLYLQI